MKIHHIIFGSLLQPIVIGEPALIRNQDELRRTSRVVDIQRVSPGEIRFETRNTRYILKVVPAHNLVNREGRL